MRIPEIITSIADRVKPVLTRKNIVRGGLAVVTVGAVGAGCYAFTRSGEQPTTSLPQTGEQLPILDQATQLTPSPIPWQPPELTATPFVDGAYPASAVFAGDGSPPPIAWGGNGCEDVNHLIEIAPGEHAPFTHKPENGVTVLCVGNGDWFIEYPMPDGTIKRFILHVDPLMP